MCVCVCVCVKAAADLASSGSNEGLKKIAQDQQLKLYGWFKQVGPARAHARVHLCACVGAT